MPSPREDFDLDEGDIILPASSTPPPSDPPTTSLDAATGPPLAPPLDEGHAGNGALPSVDTPATPSVDSLPDFAGITDDDDDFAPLPSYAVEEMTQEELEEADAEEIPAEDLIDVPEPGPFAQHLASASSAPAGEQAREMPAPGPTTPGPPSDDEAAARVWQKEDAVIDYQGDLRGFRLADLLHHCSMQVKTGLITLQREGHRKRIYVQRGAPTYVDSLLREETLGAFLLKREIIDEDQHRIAIAKMSGSGRRLGEVLIDMGVLRAKEAFRHLSEHIQSKVISAFGWTDGSYAFKELPRLPPEIIGVPMNTPNLIVQGMRAHFDPAFLPPDFPAFDSASGMKLEAPAYSEDELTLSPTASRIREELEAGTSIDSLVRLVGAPLEQVMGVTYALFTLQVVGLSDRPGTAKEGRPIDAETSASIKLDGEQFETLNETCDAFLADYLRLRPLDCFRLLGLHPDDDDDDDDDAVNRAFDKLRERLHPETFDPVEIAAVAVKVDELWTQIYLAHRTLSNAEGRAKYRQSLDEAARDSPGSSGTRGPEHAKALAGESYFQAGRVAIAAGRFDEALDAFDKALDAAPTDPSYLAHRAWTMYCSDPATNRQHAIAELNTTRSLDSSYPGVNYFLGRICLDDGANEIALGYFEMALRADPDFREAQHYMQLTKSKIFAAKRPAPVAEKPGRLSRLFRRKK
jgi:tetratricopeptide (TPR) repeat protein